MPMRGNVTSMHPDCPMGLNGQLEKNGSKKLITMFCQGARGGRKLLHLLCGNKKN